MGHDAGVGDWTRHGDITIQRNGTQIENGSGAHPDVQCQPHVAPDVTEYPDLEITN